MIKARRVEKLNAYEKYTLNKIHQKSKSVKFGIVFKSPKIYGFTWIKTFLSVRKE